MFIVDFLKCLVIYIHVRSVFSGQTGGCRGKINSSLESLQRALQSRIFKRYNQS